MNDHLQSMQKKREEATKIARRLDYSMYFSRSFLVSQPAVDWQHHDGWWIGALAIARWVQHRTL